MTVFRRISAALAAVATASLLLAAGGARAGTGGGPCSVPGGAHRVASVAGVLAWWQTVPTPASVRRQYGAGATYRSYSGCAPGLQPHVLFRDYVGDDVAIRVAGDYVGLLDRGAMESLYLSDLLTGRTTSTRAFTLSLQDNGGSEANEPGPLVTWTVTPGGWLVYLDGLSDFEGFGTALVVVSQSGATTLDLAPNGPTPEPAEISRLVVRGNTVHWWSSLTGSHHVKLRRRLLPAGLPNPLPNACQLVPPSLAQEVLGPLAATPPPPLQVPPTGFWPRVRTGTGRSGCAYVSAATPAQTLDVTEQRVTHAVVTNQQRAIGKTPRADSALVLPGIAAMLFSSTTVFAPSGPEDLRLFIHDVEIDITTTYGLTTNSNSAALEVETVGLAIERALRDAPPAASHG